jgi:hypothetical protein
MAITAAQITNNGATAFAATMNLADVPASSTPLYVCYSAKGPSGPFIASAVGLMNVTAPTISGVSPNVTVENCDLPNITVSGLFCTSAPNATIAFSENPACPLASLMAVTNATVRPDGQSVVGVNVDLSSITSAMNLYVCYSPTGPGGPFYPSDSALLTMKPSSISAVTPNVTAAGCTYAVRSCLSDMPPYCYTILLIKPA